MPAEQKEIYYLIGESRELIETSPLLEAFKAKGQEVLLLTDPIDEFLFPSLREYKGKALKPVDRADTDVTGATTSRPTRSSSRPCSTRSRRSCRRSATCGCRSG